MVSALDKAVADRQTISHTVKWLKKKVTPGMEEAIIDMYMRDTAQLKVDIVDTHRKILACSPADVDAQILEHEALLDEALDIQKDLTLQKAAKVTAQSPSASGLSGSGGSSIRLPKFDLPTFTGDMKDWMSFKDLFQASVSSNGKLSDAQKLTYLQSCLSGEAGRLLKSLDCTNANFKIGWDLLERRYNNERELFFTILKRFTGQPIVTGDSKGLCSLLDVSTECIRALKILKVPVDSWDGILIFIMVQKLDPDTRREWELSMTTTDIPKMAEFTPFLEQRVRALAACKQKAVDPLKKVHVHHGRERNSDCCTMFDKRIELVRVNFLCFNCLREGHRSSQCTSKNTCMSCTAKHHSLLHLPKPNSRTSSTAEPSAQNHHANESSSGNQGMLATAVVRVKDARGEYQLFRALLDGGSTSSFVTEDCVRKLGLRRSRTNTEVLGLASASLGCAKGVLTVEIRPRFEEDLDTAHLMTALIMPKITGKLPVQGCDPKPWKHLKGLPLADPTYHRPGQVDLLLGSDVFWDLLEGGKAVGKAAGSPVGVQTSLGWLVAGNLGKSTSKPVAHFALSSLDETLQRFWELESVPSTRAHTREEKACEDHFDATARRDETGRFVVELPVKPVEPGLGASREIAIRRLKSLEKRLERNPDHLRSYNEFMREYLNLGHMELVPTDEIHSSCKKYYIPHQFVLKQESSTTKFRVVFDASAKSSSGLSLNDTLMVGPTIQDSLLTILLRFRTHPVAFTADIAKMYRQIRVAKPDTELQRIVWRENPSGPILDFRLTTATYGTASAPYHATKVLQRLADEEQSLPLASAVTSRDFYVDDLMSGAENVEMALKIQNELLELMRRGGLNLRKWSSNSPELLAALPPDMRETQIPLSFDLDESIKTLGLRWNPGADEFFFKVSLPTPPLLLTKRSLLSEMSKVFDPLGWLAPTVIRAKIIFQQLWKLEIGWDDPLPVQIQAEFREYRENLVKIEDIRIPRCIIPVKTESRELLGFCDASERAYAAVVYMRTMSQGQRSVHLITSKTRVAPSKTISLPRLELCGSLLLAHLMDSVREALNVPIDGLHAWTDSTVVLAWLKLNPSVWKTFVANRVTQVQEILPYDVWSHVSGVDNPADCASRGLDPGELQNHPLWWTGPSWLVDYQATPSVNPEMAEEDEPLFEHERKRIGAQVLHVKVANPDSLLLRYSSLIRLKRITGWCFRFLNNCRATKSNQSSFQLKQGPLSAAELDDALLVWIKAAQSSEYEKEIDDALSGNVSSKSQLKSLNPILDSSKILRVGGRLRHSTLDYAQRHPIILPKQHKLTELIIRHEHNIQFHGGAQLIQSVLQRRFWIIRARDVIRLLVRKCVVCTRHRQSTSQQMMADLPAVRATPAPAFMNTGVDYAGPFVVRGTPKRSKVTMKAYLALFVCMVTRAIHLEIVSSMTTDEFLAALRRFIARRGRPAEMFSDCGSNFVGANRELKEMLALFNSEPHQQKVGRMLGDQGIQWRFNPPSAPHFGGLWEAGVKSAKHHLYRVIGSTRLTFEELSTLSAQVEACLNSRPLTPMSTSPEDFTALTPGHFLIGRPLTSIAEPNLMMEKVNRLSRWQLIQQCCQHFWKRWASEYLTRLQQRPKWLQHRSNLKKDDLVLVKDDNLPPLHWKLARVVETHPGPDGLTRVVTVKTQDGEFRRPVVKLCLLPVDPAVQKSDEAIDHM